MSKKAILHVENIEYCGIYENYMITVPDDFNYEYPSDDACVLMDQLGADLYYDYVYEAEDNDEEMENDYFCSWEDYNEENWGDWKEDYNLTNENV